MKKSKIGLIVLGFYLALSGCSKAPALKVYGLDVPQVDQVIQSRYANKSVKVTHPQSLREQMSQKMNFSYSMSDRGTYLNSEWSNDMSKLLQGTIIEVLGNAKIFKVVLSDTTTLKENYRLESNIFAFEHRVRGEVSDAVVSVQFTLINADTGKLAKTKRFSYSEPTPTVDANGYARATNNVIERLSQDLVNWLR
jgi:cholesterol transport system auxiliary component